MKLTSLQIERFGTRSNLQLEGLSDHLNVIYGPNGSGKTTIINFIRWMLYGSIDDSSRRFLRGSEARYGGTLRLVDGQQHRRRIERYYDAIHGDQVRVVQDEANGASAIHSQRLTGVDVDEYGQVFCFGFDQPPSIERLIEVTTARDMALAYDPTQMQRLSDLTARLEELRRDHRVWAADESLSALRERRRQLQDDLEHTERRYGERRQQMQQECDSLAAEIAADRCHMDSLQAMLRRTEATLEARRGQLEQDAYHAQQTRARWLEERRQEVAEIDYQIQQWESVLESIRQRQQHLHAQLSHCQPQPALSTPTNEADLRAFLRSLSYQVDEIEQDYRDWESVDETIEPRMHGEYRSHADYLRHVLGAALQTTREDVQRLCRELQRQQSNAQYHDRTREHDHLRRCEAELKGLIETLNGRRQALSATPEFSELPWADPTLGTAPVNGTAVVRPWYDETWASDNGVRHPHHHATHSDPWSAARLAHLMRRRDHLLARISELETRLGQLDHRRTQLQSSPQSLEEARQLEMLRRALNELDQRMAEAEQAERRREETISLERQIDELRRQLGPSDVLREASSLLHRLTDGTYRVLRIKDRHMAWVEDSRGHALEYRELSRGARDQVYLSLALAIVAAYRRRGIELPMVLNDVFVNIDADRAQATAELLAHFASRGHQIILLTRHEHVIQRFSTLPAKLYTLRQRQRMEEPLRPPVSAPRELPPRAETYYLDQVPIAPLRAAWDAPPSYRESSRRKAPYDWVAHWDPPRRTAAIRVEPEAMVETPAVLIAEEAPLADVPWLNGQHVERLSSAGIRTVGQFLELNPEEGERHLADFSTPAATVYLWQSQLSLQCHVGLTANDAALLVACGVDDPEELSYSDVSQLHRRIEDFLTNPDSRNRFGSIARFERSRLSRWIQAARRSHFRRQRWVRSRPVRPPQSSNQPITYRGEPVERLTPRTRRVDPLRPVKVPEPVDTPEPPPSDPSEALRFFLEPSDPIVDCPSIGPKTAERFHAIGVTTVAELLELEPADAAKRINYRRISDDLVRAWQLQTALVCRVPNLRGHDAQLLVACNIPGPEQLAKMEADTLFAQVKKLLSTAEGKRILRSAKRPMCTKSPPGFVGPRVLVNFN